ncbi:hypothetical protein D3C72_2491940 [compost metagenome]
MEANDCISKLAATSRPPITSIEISCVSGTTIGRLESMCGAIGAMTQQASAGCTIGPPTDSA